MGSKTNSQQAPVHWLREITKAKFGQVWTSQDKENCDIYDIENFREPKGRRNFLGIANSKEKGIQIEW